MIGQCLERFWHMGTSISLYYFRISETPFGKPNDLILEIKHQLKISIEKRLAIKNAFQRAYSTNLENMSVHLVIKIEKFGNQTRVSFEKSNTINFGNQKCQLRNQTRQMCSLEKSNAINFGNQKCHLRNQTRQILEIKSVI